MKLQVQVDVNLLMGSLGVDNFVGSLMLYKAKYSENIHSYHYYVKFYGVSINLVTLSRKTFLRLKCAVFGNEVGKKLFIELARGSRQTLSALKRQLQKKPSKKALKHKTRSSNVFKHK